jgi:dolichyl-phosphate beta-glucosyltransferase
MTSPQLSIIIPAYNEAERLPPTLREILGYVAATDRRAEVIVVDDGRTDATSERVRSVGAGSPCVRLIRLPQNRGKGFAVRTGVVNATGERILFADADGSTPIAELERLELALAGGAQLAVGSRALEAGGVVVSAKLFRRAAGKVFQALVRLLADPGVVDTQCGFKLFTAESGHDLFSRLRMNGFSFDVELLMMARRAGYSIAEVPVNWTHRPGSRVNVLLDGPVMALDLLTIRSNAARGRYDRPHIRVHATPATVPVLPGAASTKADRVPRS